MPVVVPRKVKPAEEAPKAEATQPAVTHAEVQALLAGQAAEFAQQIEAVTRAFAGALTAIASQPKDQHAAGWDFKVKYQDNGAIDCIKATPIKLH